nr:TraR/DksA C4-type zinc finger protein [Ornithinimicrobium cavernae]
MSKPAKKVADLPVLEQEDPWTPAELAEVRTELEADRERLQAEVDEAEADLAELMRDSGEGSGDDQADAGAATWEREHELSLTNNAKELLEQIEHALERIEEGTYGTCESCGNPIGKMRLQAFPRATLCLTCKQKQERR